VAPKVGAGYLAGVRIVARRTLRELWARRGHRDAEPPLRAWYAEVMQARWKAPADVEGAYRNASLVGGDRVVFHVGGNEHRLFVAIKYSAQIVFIRFVATHADYDDIDAGEAQVMDTRPIHTERQHRAALEEIERLWAARPGTPDHDRLEVLATLAEDWEEKHHPIYPPDPVAAIRVRVEQVDLDRRALEPSIGFRLACRRCSRVGAGSRST
jgi:mRNA interferase HigB